MDPKRRWRRTSLHARAVANLNGRRFFCRMLDLSARGAALTSPVCCATGQPVRLELYLGEIAGWVTVQGRLVRQARRGVGYLWGVCFDPGNRGPMTFLASFLSERLRRLSCKGAGRRPPGLAGCTRE